MNAMVSVISSYVVVKSTKQQHIVESVADVKSVDITPNHPSYT